MGSVFLSCPPENRDVEESGQLNHPGIRFGLFFFLLLLIPLDTGQDLECSAVCLPGRSVWE